MDAKRATEVNYRKGLDMDISGVQTTAIASSVGQNDVAGIAVLKKAMDIQEQTAIQLIESIPKLPDNVGNTINIKV